MPGGKWKAESRGPGKKVRYNLRGPNSKRDASQAKVPFQPLCFLRGESELTGEERRLHLSSAGRKAAVL